MLVQAAGGGGWRCSLDKPGTFPAAVPDADLGQRVRVTPALQRPWCWPPPRELLACPHTPAGLLPCPPHPRMGHCTLSLPWRPPVSSLQPQLWSIPMLCPADGHRHGDTATPARPLTLEVGQRHHLAGDGAGRGLPPFHVPPRQRPLESPLVPTSSCKSLTPRQHLPRARSTSRRGDTGAGHRRRVTCRGAGGHGSLPDPAFPATPQGPLHPRPSGEPAAPHIHNPVAFIPWLYANLPGRNASLLFLQEGWLLS